jgi:GNAT superfamily N-acetyltransferase
MELPSGSAIRTLPQIPFRSAKIIGNPFRTVAAVSGLVDPQRSFSTVSAQLSHDACRPIAAISHVGQTADMATDGFQVRAALPADIATIGKIVAASWWHTFDGLVSADFLATLTAEQQAARHSRSFSKAGAIYRVATMEGYGVVGFASGGPSRQVEVFRGAELYAIYLRPEFERQGLGRALFKAVALELLDTSRDGFYLSALSVNPNCQFYRSMGGQELRVPDIQLGNETYSQIGFFWKQLSI